MAMDPFSSYIPIIGSLVGTIALVGGLIDRKLSRRNDKQEEEILKLKEALLEIEKKRIIFETQFNIFWDYYKQEVPKVLTHPHTPELDALHRIMEKRDLTDEEKRKYVELVGDIIDRNYDLPYVAEKIGVYASMRARFRQELKMPEEIQKINEHFEQKKQELRSEYEQAKSNNRSWKFWK